MLTYEEIRDATKSLCDGDGLWLKVKLKRDGSYFKRWVFYYPHIDGERSVRKKEDGKPGAIKVREISIGSATKITAKKAREKAETYRQWVRDEIDPISERAKIAEQAGYTVLTALKKYDKLKVQRESETYQDTLRIALKYIEPRIGRFHPSVCTPTFLIEHLQFENITRGNRPAFWTCLMGIFDLAVFDGVITSNPAAKSSGIRRYVPKAEGEVVSHGSKALPRERLWELMACFETDKDDRSWDGLPVRPISSYLTQFYLTTGIRPHEVLAALWDQMDEAKGIWRVPKTKISLEEGGPRLARDVPITPTMARVLKDVREIAKKHGLPAGDNDPVFPKIEKKKTDGKPYGRQAIYTRLNKVCAANGLPLTNLHALRTNLKGWGGSFMAKYGYRHYAQLVEIQLGHKVPGKVARAYSAQDDDWAERCKMMETYDKFWNTPYADFLKELQS